MGSGRNVEKKRMCEHNAHSLKLLKIKRSMQKDSKISASLNAKNLQ